MMNDAIREMELPSGECASITLTSVRSEDVIKLITCRVQIVLCGATCVLSNEIVIKSLPYACAYPRICISRVIRVISFSNLSRKEGALISVT